MNTMVIKIIWGALTLSQLMYGVILYITPGSGGPAGAALPLWIPAIGCALISIFLFTTRLSNLVLQTLFAHNPPQVAAQRVFPFYIICWAMNESVTLFGFVTAFLSDHNLAGFLPFLLAGVALNVVMFPQLDRHIRESEARRAATGETA